MTVVWNVNTMGTGIEEIDAQHRELIARYNRFYDAIMNSAGRGHLLELLGFLASYANRHFPDEEDLMAAHRCRAAGPNMLAHQAFIEMISRIGDQLRDRAATILDAVEVETALASWLRTHFCTVDITLRTTAPSEFHREKSA